MEIQSPKKWTCRLDSHWSTDLVLPEYDHLWLYAIRRGDDAVFASGERLFEPTWAIRNGQHQVVSECWHGILEPSCLGNWAWVGNHARLLERVEVDTGQRFFEAVVGVTNPDGMTRPDGLLGGMVMRGTGQYADIACRYDPEKRAWQYGEYIHRPHRDWRRSSTDLVYTDDISGCAFPDWAKTRLTQVYIPKVEAWLLQMAAKKQPGERAPQVVDLPDVRMKHKHWSEVMTETGGPRCETCMKMTGFRKAPFATVRAAPRYLGYNEPHYYCDEHAPERAIPLERSIQC
jgi:hypothetical protein